MKKMALLLVLVFLCGGCPSTKMGAAMPTVAKVADTVPGLAHQMDDVYAYLVAQKLVPDRCEAATQALAALDAVAPMVKAGAEALAGDKFNWAQFVIHSALIAAQIMGYVAPFL